MNWNMGFKISNEEVKDYRYYFEKWKTANTNMIHPPGVHYLDENGTEIKKEIPDLYLNNQCRFDWITELAKRNMLGIVPQEEIVFSFEGVFFRQIHEDFLRIDDQKGNIVNFWQVAYSLEMIESAGVELNLVRMIDWKLNNLVIQDVSKEFSDTGVLNILNVLGAWYEFRIKFYNGTKVRDKIYDYKIAQGLYKKNIDVFKKLRDAKFWQLWNFGVYVVWIYNRCINNDSESDSIFMDYQCLATFVWRDILAAAHRNGFDDDVYIIRRIIKKIKSDKLIDEADYEELNNSEENEMKGGIIVNNNTFYNNINGNSNNIQIQQGTKNSTQIQNNGSDEGIDYKACAEIIENIRKCESLFDNEFKDKSPDAKKILEEAEQAISKKDDGALKKAFLELKNFAEGVGASVVASGILNLLNGLPFLAV